MAAPANAGSIVRSKMILATWTASSVQNNQLLTMHQYGAGFSEEWVHKLRSKERCHPKLANVAAEPTQ